MDLINHNLRDYFIEVMYVISSEEISSMDIFYGNEYGNEFFFVNILNDYFKSPIYQSTSLDDLKIGFNDIINTDLVNIIDCYNKINKCFIYRIPINNIFGENMIIRMQKTHRKYLNIGDNKSTKNKLGIIINSACNDSKIMHVSIVTVHHIPNDFMTL
jgi:hypothetical protein